MMPSLWVLTLLAVAASYCWSVVLVEDGMLLRPLRSRLLGWMERRYGIGEENWPWWWKPLWGCFRCNVVWMAGAYFAAGRLAPAWVLSGFVYVGFACVALLLISFLDKWLNN
ncbi:hypothetical protein LJ737_20730 [Hymenobacter sp. 15J16-1T3B]|uniref:hypothetical protein n=1 Tax=Hymenobacter sp. 15J16-1T3B TaxID=2886941 RepID=UPI001D12A41E|nr:hypothetical protein [Hymenobacter sp. 15J16-1T3B]MCC3159679.1 hypothetical protein [Hymenobacter sp. 15J16-1T3B]